MRPVGPAETVADARPSSEPDGSDQKQAIAEGWCVMDPGKGNLEIQRDDEQDTFVSDEEAEAHVIARAEEGSAYHHHDALALVALSRAEG